MVAALAMTAVLLRGPSSSAGPEIALLVVAFAALAVMVAAELRERRLRRGAVLAVGAALLVLAVVVPPMQSNDVWSYATYGRMVSEYGVSPYRHAPADYPDDPVAARSSDFWRDSPSVYGPVFTGVSAVGMEVAGTSRLKARLFFQGLAALAVLASLVLVDRRLKDPMAVAFLAVNPVTVIAVVNGGHNDAVIGLALLGGVLLVAAKRPAWAGAVVAVGALVKIAALLPVAAVAVWVWRRRGNRPALAFAGAAGGVVAAGLVLAGGPVALRPLRDAALRFTNGSVWAAPRRWLASALTGPGRDAVEATKLSGRILSTLALVCAVGLTVLVLRGVRRPGVAQVVGVSVLAYMLLGAYVLPWYLAWSLPALALTWRWPLAWLAVAQAGILQVTTVTGAPGQSRAFQHSIYGFWLPILEAVAVVALVVTAQTSYRRVVRTRKTAT
ncbi:MAG: alpha,6-mannosyltransferase [Actinomycetota bacterium]|nr:alpha,6-mannosyltransferase [Actinomycetota bacterium]